MRNLCLNQFFRNVNHFQVVFPAEKRVSPLIRHCGTLIGSGIRCRVRLFPCPDDRQTKLKNWHFPPPNFSELRNRWLRDVNHVLPLNSHRIPQEDLATIFPPFNPNPRLRLHGDSR